MMKTRHVKRFTKEELEKKSTKELLGILKRLRRCEESFELSDQIEDPDINDKENIYFKRTEKWKNAYHDLKAILNNREHIKRNPKH